MNISQVTLVVAGGLDPWTPWSATLLDVLVGQGNVNIL